LLLTSLPIRRKRKRKRGKKKAQSRAEYETSLPPSSFLLRGGGKEKRGGEKGGERGKRGRDGGKKEITMLTTHLSSSLQAHLNHILRGGGKGEGEKKGERGEGEENRQLRRDGLTIFSITIYSGRKEKSKGKKRKEEIARAHLL